MLCNVNCGNNLPKDTAIPHLLKVLNYWELLQIKCSRVSVFMAFTREVQQDNHHSLFWPETPESAKAEECR